MIRIIIMRRIIPKDTKDNTHNNNNKNDNDNDNENDNN